MGPGDGNAMARYTEQYQYDAAGNFVQFIHSGSQPANPGWTRTYTYGEKSLLEPWKIGNRLTQTTVSGSQPLVENYTHDAHGNMTSMPQLQAMLWDFKNALQMTQRQAVNAGDTDGVLHQGERTYYVYQASGQRARKITESSAGIKKKERFYLGGFEVYREYDSGGAVTLERESLRVMDDMQRIALVETRTQGNDGLPSQLMRFQFSNHLGSASLELDDAAQVISYEEYCPYGNTSYQAGRSTVEVGLKRYRYTGMERDEESGLNYHTARYYATWLARWTSCDPVGPSSSVNLYAPFDINPLRYVDLDGNSPVDPPTGFWKKLVAKGQQIILIGRVILAPHTHHTPIDATGDKVGDKVKEVKSDLEERLAENNKPKIVPDPPKQDIRGETVHGNEGEIKGVRIRGADEVEGLTPKSVTDTDAPNVGEGAQKTEGGASRAVGLLVAIGLAALQSKDTKEFAENTALNVVITKIPELGAITAKDEGTALTGIVVGRYVGPAIGKHIVGPILSHPLTWVAAAEVGVAYLLFMDKSSFMGDQKRADKAIERYRAGENVDAFCDQCHGKGGALDPENERNLKYRYKDLNAPMPVPLYEPMKQSGQTQLMPMSVPTAPPFFSTHR
jgi:RHS repeat-associated protein